MLPDVVQAITVACDTLAGFLKIESFPRSEERATALAVFAARRALLSPDPSGVKMQDALTACQERFDKLLSLAGPFTVAQREALNWGQAHLRKAADLIPGAPPVGGS